MADTAIQLPYLSSHYALPESTLTTLTQAPTVELVNQLLESIGKKAHEFDELKADKLRLEVELENAVRSNESKVKVLKTSVEKGHAEVADLRKKLQEAGIYHSILQQLMRYFLTPTRKYTLYTRERNLYPENLINSHWIRSRIVESAHLLSRGLQQRHISLA
jgi:DNA repair exonuclease SbcCD ATPase subunit